MFSSKKGLEPHLIILVVVSIVMGIFLTGIFSAFYGTEPEKCFSLDFTVEDTCRTSSEIVYTVSNRGVSLIRFQVNDQLLEDQVSAVDSGEVSYAYSSDETQFRFVPMVNEGVETLECRSKLKNTNIEDIPRC